MADGEEDPRGIEAQAGRTMLRYILAALLLLRCGAPVSAQTPSTANGEAAAVTMQELAPGDHWTYEVKDQITGTLKLTHTDTVTDVSNREVAVRFAIAGTNRSNNIVYDRSWNILHVGLLRYSPNDGTGLQFPLTLNAQWKFAIDLLNAQTGLTFRRTGTSRVVKQESVTTKAGSFDCFLVETEFTARNVQDPRLINQYSWRTWFDPKINHWVKRSELWRQSGLVVGNDMVELVEFGRRKEQ